MADNRHAFRQDEVRREAMCSSAAGPMTTRNLINYKTRYTFKPAVRHLDLIWDVAGAEVVEVIDNPSEEDYKLAYMYLKDSYDKIMHCDRDTFLRSPWMLRMSDNKLDKMRADLFVLNERLRST